jgi:hypothetical protein
MPDAFSFSFTPDGSIFSIPLQEGHDTTVDLNGVFNFAENGKPYDALYTTDAQSGQWTQAHTYLEWLPEAPPLASEDKGRHRYIFRVPAEWIQEKKSLSVRVNLEKFVEDFIHLGLTPSQVRAALSGELQVNVAHLPLAVPLLPRIAPVAIPALVVAGGVALVVRRRMMWGGLSHDLQQTLMGIEQKYRTACAAVSKEHRQLFPLNDKLTALRDGAFAIARQIQKLRNAQQLSDRRALEADIARLEQQRTTLRDEAAQRDADIILNEKRRTLALLGDMEQNASRCALRLTKIEATLDALAITLRHAQTQHAPEPVEETLRRQLDAEVTALQDTTREMQAFEALRAQMAAQRTR